VPAGSLPHLLLWDTGDPYHYVRLQRDEEVGGEILIVGGEDRKTGQEHPEEDGDRFRALEEWTRARFPMAGDVAYRWSGQVMEPVDFMAMIGRNPGSNPNQYLVTGDSGNGMTHGTLAGILLTDLIVGRSNPWATLYDPSRVTLGVSSAKEFAKENLNVAAQYAKDYVRPGEVKSVEEIAVDSGAILRDGRKLLAVYRDESGVAHRLDAKCTHLKCIVHWNPLEKSWDCPCHGSRFDRFGKVLNGPAIAGLEEVSE
jgi:Rieske Fe-S protein